MGRRDDEDVLPRADITQQANGAGERFTGGDPSLTSGRWSRPVGRATAIPATGIFVILLIGALHYAQHFVIPIALSVLLALSLSPVVSSLSRWGVPRVVSAFSLVAALALTTLALSVILSGPIADMAAEMPKVAHDLRVRFADISQPLAQLSRASSEVQAAADGAMGASSEEKVVIAGPGLISWMAGGLTNIGTTLGVTLALTPFLLMSRNSLYLRLIDLAPSINDRSRSLRTLDDIENEISRYLLTIATINAGLGCAVGLSMAALGMPNPWLWGIGAALLNFIPYAGATVGIVLTAAVAVTTFEGIGAIAPPLVYLALQLIESTLVTPFALGRRLEINVVVILITLMLTTWMWGIVGAVIGVPLLVVLKVICERYPSLARVAAFLSVSSTPEEDLIPDDPDIHSRSPVDLPLSAAFQGMPGRNAAEAMASFALPVGVGSDGMDASQAAPAPTSEEWRGGR